MRENATNEDALCFIYSLKPTYGITWFLLQKPGVSPDISTYNSFQIYSWRRRIRASCGIKLVPILPPFYCVFKKKFSIDELRGTHFFSKNAKFLKKSEIWKVFGKNSMSISSIWLQIDGLWRLLIQSDYKIRYSDFSLKNRDKCRKFSTSTPFKFTFFKLFYR